MPPRTTKKKAPPMAQRPSAPPAPLLRLDDIVGQAGAVGRLRRAVELARLPHALLFWGPSGVGKQTVARSLAAAILCTGRDAALAAVTGAIPLPVRGEGHDTIPCPPVPSGQAPTACEHGTQEIAPAADACGRCDDCRMMAAGTHPDFNLVYKELAAFHEDPAVRDRVMQALSIDVIKSFLIAPTCRAPARGRGKVFVVPEAELMSDDAQNCLLKTLEEPPPGVTIILLAERPEELLPTTRSRCSLVRFDPLPLDFVAGKLIAAGVEESQARFWAALTAGSVGEALRLAKEGLYPVKQRLLAELAALGGGEGGFGESLGKVAEGLADSAVRQAKEASGAEMSKTLATRQGVAVVLQILASAVRDAMGLRCARQQGLPSPPLIHSDQPAEIQALARRLGPDQLAEVLEQLAEYERLLWRNVNPKLLWDNAAITLSSAAPLRL